MAIYKTATRYIHPNTSSNVNWLLANIGDPILIEHDIEVKEYVLSSTDNSFVANNTNGYLPTAGTIWVTGGDFSKFDVGDTIQIYNYIVAGSTVSTTIVEKLSNTEIRLASNPVGWAANTSSTQDVFSLVKTITSIDYKWNFIENGDPTNYYSRVDGSEQIARATGLNAAGGGTNKPMTFLGLKDYQVGSVVIDEIALVTTGVYTSKFKIKHTTKITPTMLAEQWDDIVNGVAPTYFNNMNCFKSAFYFEGRNVATDPNNVETLEEDNVLGNTGWFNENFNTKLTNYNFTNLVYKETNSAGATLPAPVLSNSVVTYFEFDVFNTSSSPFVNGSSKIILNFHKAPNDESEYQGKNRTLLHNFVWENANATVSSTPTPVNGENYSDTSIRSLYQVEAEFISSTQITVRGYLTFHQDGVDVFNESAEPRFLFFVSVQNHSLAANVSDRVTLLLDAKAFYFQTLFPDLIDVNAYLIPHFLNTYTQPANPDYNIYTEDEIVGFAQFTIDDSYLGGGNTFEVLKFTAKLVMRDTITNDEFTLEQYVLNANNFPYVGDMQHIEIIQSKNIHVPTTEIRKDLGVATNLNNFRYFFAYPYLNNWETWNALANVDSSFFSGSQPNNGLNKDWAHYNTGRWSTVWKPSITVKYNGNPATYEGEFLYDIFDRNTNPGYISASSIETFDPDTLAHLTNGGVDYILGYKPTLVEVNFERTSAFANNSWVQVVIGIEVKGEGGVTGKRRMSTQYDSDSDTWFMPLAGATRVTKTIVGTNDAVGCQVLIDFTKIDLTKLDYKLSARLYETI